MKYIRKQQEPQSLTNYRSAPGAVYAGYRDKDDLRRSLIKEQGHICCYCMQRITLESMHIEHWKPRSLFPRLQLDYKNLLGVCGGNQGKPGHLQHCDKRKGNNILSINPVQPGCEKLVKFRGNGEIYSPDQNVNRELNRVLNLNMQTIVVNRKNILDFAIRRLTLENPRGTWSKSFLKKEIGKWQTLGGEGKYEPYCRIVIYFLEKKLAKSTA